MMLSLPTSSVPVPGTQGACPPEPPWPLVVAEPPAPPTPTPTCDEAAVPPAPPAELELCEAVEEVDVLGALAVSSPQAVRPTRAMENVMETIFILLTALSARLTEKGATVVVPDKFVRTTFENRVM